MTHICDTSNGNIQVTPGINSPPNQALQDDWPPFLGWVGATDSHGDAVIHNRFFDAKEGKETMEIMILNQATWDSSHFVDHSIMGSKNKTDIYLQWKKDY